MDEQLMADLPPLQEPAKDGAPLRRPMNAFLIFCKKHRALVREKNPHLDNRSVTRILGELWATLPSPEKDSYLSLAKQYRDAFLKANPGYHWHSSKRESQAAFKPVQRNTPATLTSASGSNSKVIESGKLADPSNMGGLGLLLMAGSGVTPHNAEATSVLARQPHTVMRPPPQHLGKKPGRPVVPSTTTRAPSGDGPDNVALLQLAEMCSSRLESSERPANENLRPREAPPPSHGAVNQQWLPGSYAMTPPWTPKYEGQVSPKHELSPTEHKDFPLDLSKPPEQAKIAAKVSASVTGKMGEDLSLKHPHGDSGKPSQGASHPDPSLDRKCVSSTGGTKSRDVPSGRMLVNQMIETVFHSDMLLEPKTEDHLATKGPPARKRSLSLSETGNTGNSSGEGCLNNNKVPAMTFGEIQEEIIRKAMEDNAFTGGKEKKQAIQQPLNLSHVGMDLATQNTQSLPSYGVKTSSYPSSPVQMKNQASLNRPNFLSNMPFGRQFEAMNIGLMRDVMLDKYRQVSKGTGVESAKKSSESVDLTCTEDLEGYDSGDNRCKASGGQNKVHLGGTTGQKLRDQIETQLASHLMASAGVLPPSFVSGNQNYKSDTNQPQQRRVEMARNNRKENPRQVDHKTPQLGSGVLIKDRCPMGFMGELNKKIANYIENQGIMGQTSLVSNSEEVSGENITEKQKTTTDVSDLRLTEGGISTNQEPEKKVRRRRRNVMEMTLDPYGENRDQTAGRGSESPEDKVTEHDLLDDKEEDESGVRKSKRRNRGQKYQELLSQGLLQVGRQRKSDSLSESTEGAPLEQPVMRRPRKSTTSDTSPNVSRDEVFTDSTSFDLDAEIASLPAVALDVAPVRRGGTRTRGRHRASDSDGGRTATSRGQGGRVNNTARRDKQVKELSIAELGRLTKVSVGPDNQKSGSQKRKARRSAITHLVLVKQGDTDGETNNNQKAEKKPSDLSNTTPHIATPPADQATNHLDFATLVDVAVAENEKIRNLKEITVSCT